MFVFFFWFSLGYFAGQIDLAGFPKPAARWYRNYWLRHPNATNVNRSRMMSSVAAVTPETDASAARIHAAITSKVDAAAKTRVHAAAHDGEGTGHRTTPAGLALGVDVPSAATCTGDKVVLDGRDVALIRIAVVDAYNQPILHGGVHDVNVTVSVVSGPGRIVGVGNGDTKTHQRPQGSTIMTHYGFARAVVMVTLDCTTQERATSAEIDGWSDGGGVQGGSAVGRGGGGDDKGGGDDADGGRGGFDSSAQETVVMARCPSPLPEIVVQARAHGTALAAVNITVRVSDDPADGALAVAQQGQPCAFSYIDSFPY